MRNLILIFALVINFNILNGQVSSDSSTVKEGLKSSKIFVGGNFSLNFGTISSIYIAPTITYALTEDIFVGLGANYEYFSDRNYVPKYDISIYGGSLFLRYFVLDNLFAHFEYEKLYYKDSYYLMPSYPLPTTDGIYLGIGYRQWISENAYMTIIALFDLQNNQFNFGTNPFLRVGFAVGL